MALSRKQYQQVAKDLHWRLDHAQDDSERRGITLVASDLAIFFAQDNGRFNRSRFLEAAGIE